MTRQGVRTACMLLLLAGCAAQTQDVQKAPEAFAGSASLRPSTEEPGAWTYIAPGARLSAYRRFILDPPRVFRGEGSAYGDLSEAEVQEILKHAAAEPVEAVLPRRIDLHTVDSGHTGDFDRADFYGDDGR